jgi:hypothetical protein
MKFETAAFSERLDDLGTIYIYITSDHDGNMKSLSLAPGVPSLFLSPSFDQMGIGTCTSRVWLTQPTSPSRPSPPPPMRVNAMHIIHELDSQYTPVRKS